MEVRPGPILLAGLAALGAWNWWEGRPVRRAPGVLAPEEPFQGPVREEERPFQLKGFRIVPLAHYSLKARVLSRERYWVEAGAGLAPVDLALGWGPMSDSKVLQALTITQDNRWYHWRAERLPIPADVIVSHSANTHVIPGDPLVRRTLLDAKEGDLLELEGCLVRVEGPGGYTWTSSLSRTDAGDGSCELMVVKEARRGPR